MAQEDQAIRLSVVDLLCDEGDFGDLIELTQTVDNTETSRSRCFTSGKGSALPRRSTAARRRGRLRLIQWWLAYADPLWTRSSIGR